MRSMSRLFGFGLICCLGGCSGNPAPNPEEPIQEMIKSVNDFAGHLEELEKQAKNAAPKDAEKALDKTADILDKMDATLSEVLEKVKRTQMTEAERRLYNTSERRRELDKAQERIGRIVGPIADLLNRKDLNPVSIRKFQQAWDKLRERAQALDLELKKWASG